MAILPIYTYGAPVLRKKAKPVAAVSDGVIKLIVDMFATMHQAGGIGLAATQVGSLQRVIVIDVSEMEHMEEVKPFAMINPTVVTQEGSWTLEEGCLSIPELRDEVERSEAVTVRFRDANFQEVELSASGILSRVILHEIDHLDGVLFIDHLPKARRKSHDEILKSIQRGEFEVEYPVITAANVAV
jgi:peptide deformylase